MTAAPSLSYEDSLIESLKDRNEAAAYLEAAIEDGDQAVLMLALRHIERSGNPPPRPAFTSGGGA